MEEEIKGLLFGEILGQEIFYNQFDTELVERLMQLGKFSVIRRIVKVINVLCLTITIIVVIGRDFFRSICALFSIAAIHWYCD